VTLSFDL